MTGMPSSCSLASLFLALALLACPATATADERFAPEDGGVTGAITTEAGRFVFLGKQGEGTPLGLLEGFGPDASPLGFTQKEGTRIDNLHLGTDAGMRPVLVFTYCAGRGCDLYRYDFDSRDVTRLPLSRKRCEESGGRMQRGVVYFARFPTPGGRAVDGCSVGVFAKRPGRPARRLLRAFPPSWDVSKGVIAFETERVLRTEVAPNDKVGITEVRTRRIGARRSRRVAVGRFRANSKNDLFSGVDLSGVALDDGLVYWLRADYGRSGDARVSDLFRAPAKGSTDSETLSREAHPLMDSSSPDELPVTFAVDGDDLYYYSVPMGTRGAITKVGPGPPKFE